MIFEHKEPVILSWITELRLRLITWLCGSDSVMVNFGVDARSRTLCSSKLTYITNCKFIDDPHNGIPMIVCDQERYDNFLDNI